MTTETEIPCDADVDGGQTLHPPKPDGTFAALTKIVDMGRGTFHDPIMQQKFFDFACDEDGFVRNAHLYQEYVCEQIGIKPAQFWKFLHRAKVVKKLGTFPNTVGELIKAFVEKNKLRATLDGRAVHDKLIEDYGETYRTAAEKLRHDQGLMVMLNILHNPEVPMTEPLGWLRVLCEDLGIKFTWAAVETAFLAWADEQRRQRYYDLYDDVGYNTGSEHKMESEWLKWADAVCADPADVPLTIAVMKSWVWQVKRKMCGLPVDNHLMPVFVGRQKGGKSTAVSKFVAPLAEGVVPATFRDVEDERCAEMFHWFPVLVLDEMEHGSKADVEAIKSRITAGKISYKPLYTNARKILDMRASFVGTSNRGVNEIINDPTGMRRFYQVNCHDRMDWPSINSVDYQGLWRSVHEYHENPIVNMMGKLEAAQAEITSLGNVEIWVKEGYAESKRECGLNLTYGEWYEAKTIFKAFSEWEREYLRPRTPTGRRTFSNRMGELLKAGLVKRKITGRNDTTIYMVPSTCEVMEFKKTG